MCFWATWFIDLDALAVFQTAGRAWLGYKWLHIKYWVFFSPPHGFSVPPTHFPPYCIECPNVSSHFTLLHHQTFPIKQCLPLNVHKPVNWGFILGGKNHFRFYHAVIPTTCRQREGRHQLNEKGHFSPPTERRKKLCIRIVSAPQWLPSGCGGDEVTDQNRHPSYCRW